MAFPIKQRRAEERAFWRRAAGELFPSREDRATPQKVDVSRVFDEAVDGGVAIASARRRARQAKNPEARRQARQEVAQARRRQEAPAPAAKPRLTAMQKHDKLVAWLRTLSPEQRARVHDMRWYTELPEHAQDKVDTALDTLSLEEVGATEGLAAQALVEYGFEEGIGEYEEYDEDEDYEDDDEWSYE
jgi:hypothetical protein